MKFWFIRKTVLGPVLWVGWFSVIDRSFPMHLTGMLPAVWFAESGIIGIISYSWKCRVPTFGSYQIPWNVLGYAKRFCGAFSKFGSWVMMWFGAWSLISSCGGVSGEKGSHDLKLLLKILLGWINALGLFSFIVLPDLFDRCTFSL